MVAPVKPQKIKSHGKDSWWLVPAVANLNVPTIVEINAATGINMSCTLLASFEGLSGTAAKVTLDAFLCETEQFEANDNVVYSMTDIVGGFDPQAAESSDDKKLFELLREGFVGYAVRRQGKTADTASPDAVVGEFVDVVPVDITRAVPGKSSNEASGIYAFTASVAVTGSPAFNVATVAGA